MGRSITIFVIIKQGPIDIITCILLIQNVKDGVNYENFSM